MLVAGRLPILQRVSNCCWHSDRPFRRTVLNLPSVSLSKAYPSTPYIHRIYHRRKLQKQFYRSVKIYPQYILQFLALLSVAYSIECLSFINKYNFTNIIDLFLPNCFHFNAKDEDLTEYSIQKQRWPRKDNFEFPQQTF